MRYKRGGAFETGNAREIYSLALETERRRLSDAGATSLSSTRELATCHASLAQTNSLDRSGAHAHPLQLANAISAVLQRSLVSERALSLTASIVRVQTWQRVQLRTGTFSAVPAVSRT